MDGSGDFRPEAEQRASDPSLEDMLRRARDAHLGTHLGTTIGNRYVPHFRRHLTSENQVTAMGWFVVLVVGMILGAIIACEVLQAGSLAGNIPPSPTDTLLPTPTDTPVPAPTDVPTATTIPAFSPPTIDEIVSLARDFYNTLGPYAATYVFMDATEVHIQSLDETQLTACIAFEFASVASPDTVAGTDALRFVLNPASDGTWQVVEMGSAASCRLN